MFRNCEFLLGKNNSVVAVIPARVPKTEPLSLSIQGNILTFRCGESVIGQISNVEQEVLRRLLVHDKVGMIEFPGNVPSFPAYITAVARIEVMSGVRHATG